MFFWIVTMLEGYITITMMNSNVIYLWINERIELGYLINAKNVHFYIWKKDTIILYAESQTPIFLDGAAFLDKLYFLFVNKYKFQFRQQMDSELGVMKELSWVPWLLKIMMKFLFWYGSQQSRWFSNWCTLIRG